MPYKPTKTPRQRTTKRAFKAVGSSKNPAFKPPITIAAIDSGQEGAIAILRANSRTDIDLLEVYKMPFNADHDLPHIETAKIAEWLRQCDYVVLESVNPIQGKGTANTMFRQGGSYFPLGEAIALAGKSEFFIMYSAQLWKSTIKCSGSVAGNKKKKTYDLVCNLFPDWLHLFQGPRGGMNDGYTDAVGIGLAWIKRNVGERE